MSDLPHSCPNCGAAMTALGKLPATNANLLELCKEARKFLAEYPSLSRAWSKELMDKLEAVLAPDPCRPSEADMINRQADADLGDRIDRDWAELIHLISGINDRRIDLERKVGVESTPAEPGEERSVPPVDANLHPSDQAWNIRYKEPL